MKTDSSSTAPADATALSEVADLMSIQSLRPSRRIERRTSILPSRLRAKRASTRTASPPALARASPMKSSGEPCRRRLPAWRPISSTCRNRDGRLILSLTPDMPFTIMEYMVSEDGPDDITEWAQMMELALRRIAAG
jgi:hypothetical protein